MSNKNKNSESNNEAEDRSQFINFLVPTAKSRMQEQFKDAIKTQVTPYYDVFNRCTAAVVKELDSDVTTVEVEEVRQVVNFAKQYATLIHKVLSSPQLQEAVIDFIVAMEEPSPAAKSKASQEEE